MASITLAGSDNAVLSRLWKKLTRAGPWLYLAPALFFFVGYQVYPIVRVFIISFTDYHYLRRDPVQWVGFQNYINAFGDSIAHQGLLRAAYFTALFLPACIFIPLL